MFLHNRHHLLNKISTQKEKKFKQYIILSLIHFFEMKKKKREKLSCLKEFPYHFRLKKDKDWIIYQFQAERFIK